MFPPSRPLRSLRRQNIHTKILSENFKIFVQYSVPIKNTLRYLEDQLHEHVMYGEGERTTGFANLVQLDLRHNNYGELLAHVGPTASSITEGNLSTHSHR